MAKNRIAP